MSLDTKDATSVQAAPPPSESEGGEFLIVYPGRLATDTKSVPRATASSATSSAEYAIVQTGARRQKKSLATSDATDEPLIDTTAALSLNSKKTKRLQKQLRQKQRKINIDSTTKNFLELPSELLVEILGYLRPSDIFRLQRLNHATKDFLAENEGPIARDVIARRYWVLSQSFPLPVYLRDVDELTQAALLHPRRELATDVHKKPYQHVRPMDVRVVCCCHSCLFAWNNLCIVLDFAHFQKNLDEREPIPMIPRGTAPAWNVDLIERNATIVERAMASPLVYAAVLSKHLASISGTLLRAIRFPPTAPKHRHTDHKSTAIPALPPYPTTFPKTVHPKRLYNLSEDTDDIESDEFLERQGDASYQLPFHRDNYYNSGMYAYVPNRKWSKNDSRWIYYATGGHERDLEWTRRWYG